VILLTGAASLSGGAQERRMDMTKSVIEAPTKRLLSVPSPLAIGKQQVDRPVQPGLVRWHADFASACLASKSSGKPVLLFQMMGKLDREYT